MRIAEFSVNRRVTVMMMTVLIVILGSISLSKLGLEMLPDMDFPVISIITSYQGAASEDVEEAITKPIEQAIASVKDVKSINSQSLENYSIVMVEFNWGTNLDFAAQDLRDMIDQISGYLPSEVSRPLVYKFNLAQMPILSYGITGNMSGYHLRKILEDEISTRLKQVTGVASVGIMGGEELEIQIFIDKNKLDFNNISIDQVVSALAVNNLNMAAGNLLDSGNDYLLRTVAQFSSIEEIHNTPVSSSQTGQVIYIKDIAEVVEGIKETRNYIRSNKEDTVFMMVSKESGTNTLTVSKRIKKEVARIESDYGGQVTFNEVMDLGFPIQKVTGGALSNLIIGGILAIFIMFLFLQNWRPTFAISVAIPISVIATFISMYLANFSLNLMTLGGLALGVGMLVDNSIVVIENIFRHLEMGKNRIEAAKVGANEVGMAITASTLTTIAVFFPMIFSEGMTGILVRGLALTVAFSLLSSLFIALTVVPVIASLIFKANVEAPTQNRFSFQRQFDKLKNRYLKMLNFVLHHRAMTLTLVTVLFFSSFGLIYFIGTDFMPERDVPFTILNLKMPVGTSLEETDTIVNQIEEIFMETDGIKNVMAIIGPMEEGMMDPGNPQYVSEAQIIGRLVDLKDRKYSNEKLQAQIRSRIPEVEGARINFLSSGEMMGGGAAHPVHIKIFGRDLNRLNTIARDIEEKINVIEGVSDVQNSMAQARPEAHIVIDKQKAFHYGLTTAQVASAIKTSTLGTIAGIYRFGGEEINIRVRLAEKYRATKDDILQLSISSPLGITIPLNQIATIEYAEGPIKIDRENQNRKVDITASVTGTRDIGGKVEEIKKELADLIDKLPAGYFVEFGGTYKDMKEAFSTLTLALILAIVLVYLVMASQFESLKQPFVVMFTIPLAAIGVMVILFLTGITLSVASFVGGIILAGIVVNNGIVLVDHTNQLIRGGMEKHEALLKAGSDRMRPVLITALTTVMGMLPMALSTQEGAEIKVPLALTVVGGLISATFFTLLVIPVIYSVVEKIKYK